MIFLFSEKGLAEISSAAYEEKGEIFFDGETDETFALGVSSVRVLEVSSKK
ncbi:hypothetical protein [Leptospira ellisii]|uniref:hypothetical protein n=1 Tax=Leptospira ellisii TaxID=2023197 RepID=UPI003C6CDB0F